MTFKEIMADKKAKRWACLSWSGSVLILVSMFFIDHDQFWFTPLIYSFLLAIQPFLYREQSHQLFPEYFENPLNQLRLEGNMLHVKQHQLEMTDVSKVAIDKMNEHTAFIDFPYNMYGKLKFSFPLEQLPAVKTFFRQHCPHIQIVS